jgi:hypothetical protein
VSILSLNIVRPSSASSSGATALLTLNVSNFQLPEDGFVIIYAVQPRSTSHSHAQGGTDDDIAASAGSSQFIDAVTYPGATAFALFIFLYTYMHISHTCLLIVPICDPISALLIRTQAPTCPRLP